MVVGGFRSFHVLVTTTGEQISVLSLALFALTFTLIFIEIFSSSPSSASVEDFFA